MEQGAVAMIAPQEPEFRQKLKALRHHPRASDSIRCRCRRTNGIKGVYSYRCPAGVERASRMSAK